MGEFLMAKMYFRYGAMGASKTANLLMVAHNYEEQGRNVLLFKPAADIRWGQSEIVSRAGDLRHKCLILGADENPKEIVNQYKDIACILVDEAQFLSKEQVKEFSQIVDNNGIPVICYGLKNSFKEGTLFEGSSALLYYADAIEEIKTICVCCNKKATMNLRIVNGDPVYDGNLIQMGDTKISEEFYLPVCRHHYHSPDEIKAYLNK